MIVGVLAHEPGAVIWAPKPLCHFMAEDPGGGGTHYILGNG